jgi:FkbM family methyltransferase
MIKKLFFFAKRVVAFYASHLPIELPYTKTYYSQHGEDVFALEFFKKKSTGFFVDVGAHHPFKLSNTYLLYKRGWRGINLEPDPRGFSLLKRYREKDINLNLAVTEKGGVVEFISDGVFSGVKNEHYKHASKKRGDLIQVKSMPLASVLEEYIDGEGAFDLLSVDCEGYDEFVLRSNDWERFRPKLVLVEDHPSLNSGTHAFLTSLGYEYLCRLWRTVAYVDKRDEETAH